MKLKADRRHGVITAMKCPEVGIFQGAYTSTEIFSNIIRAIIFSEDNPEPTLNVIPFCTLAVRGFNLWKLTLPSSTVVYISQR
jgi:hypothetical protein